MSTTAIKWLALVLMLVDHLGASLLENGLFRCSAIDPRLVGLDQLLRLAGRLGDVLKSGDARKFGGCLQSPEICLLAFSVIEI